jgi:predicted nucleic acid-binding Zn ribbon protein
VRDDESEPEKPDAEAGHGSDLARDALQAARAAASKRGKAPPRGRWRRAGGGGSSTRRRWSGAGPDERDPQPLGLVASRLTTERGWSGRLAGATVFHKWSELVGSEVAEHAEPVALRDGELIVRASSTAWATQLRTLQRQLLKRIAAGLGPDVVKRMKVIGPTVPSWRLGPRHVRGRGPRDTYG